MFSEFEVGWKGPEAAYVGRFGCCDNTWGWLDNGALRPFDCRLGTPFVAGVRCACDGFRGFGRTRGSTFFGRRIIGATPPLGVRPGVASAGEALIVTAVYCVARPKTVESREMSAPKMKAPC